MNAFLALADVQQVHASKQRDKRRERAMEKLVVKSDNEAPMVASPSDKAAWEQAQLLKNYRRAIARRKKDLLDGPHGREVKALLQLLDSLTASSASALVAYVMKAKWLREADYNTRLDVLSLVGTAICRFRIQQGLAPFDDSLPFLGEEPTAFEQIRQMLAPVGVLAPLKPNKNAVVK